MYPNDRGIRVLPQIDASDGYKYVSSLYFSVSTLATVGFGEAGTLKNSVPATVCTTTCMLAECTSTVYGSIASCTMPWPLTTQGRTHAIQDDIFRPTASSRACLLPSVATHALQPNLSQHRHHLLRVSCRLCCMQVTSLQRHYGRRLWQ
jgi:hypothetical protein